MARPREFDEDIVLDAAVQCFWSRGYEATSIRDLIAKTGITSASLYNAFGDKRTFYKKALDRYVTISVEDRIQRCEAMGPRGAIAGYFAEILKRSLGDTERKGCMLVNAAVEAAPHDPDFQQVVTAALGTIETFFQRSIEAGQADGSIVVTRPAQELARHLLGVLMGVRVLSRIRPDREVLESVIEPALSMLGRPASAHALEAHPA